MVTNVRIGLSAQKTKGNAATGLTSVCLNFVNIK